MCMQLTLLAHLPFSCMPHPKNHAFVSSFQLEAHIDAASLLHHLGFLAHNVASLGTLKCIITWVSSRH